MWQCCLNIRQHNKAELKLKVSNKMHLLFVDQYFIRLVFFANFVKKNLTDISVQDFKNCFKQWLKHWEHCKEFEEDWLGQL
jgi:hypothetical protein